MATLYDTGKDRPGGYRDVSPAEVHKVLGKVHLVDVREPHELVGELGKIAGVEAVPLARVEAACDAWPREGELVLVCRSGRRSANAAMALAARGFRRVMNLEGGMLAWNDAGLPRG